MEAPLTLLLALAAVGLVSSAFVWTSDDRYVLSSSSSRPRILLRLQWKNEKKTAMATRITTAETAAATTLEDFFLGGEVWGRMREEMLAGKEAKVDVEGGGGVDGGEG